MNFSAFPTRLTRICRSRKGSVWIVSGISPSYSTSSERFFALARTAISDRTSEARVKGE